MAPLRRRAVLRRAGAASVAGTAGCLGNLPGQSEDNDSDPSGEPENGPGTGADDASDSAAHDGMTLSLVAVDDDPDPVSFQVSVVDDQLSEATVPTVDIAVENTSTEMVTWNQAMNTYVYPGTGITPRRLQIGTEREVNNELIEGDHCAYVESIPRDDEPAITELEPDESFEQRYAVVGNRDQGGECPAPDTYRTEHEYYDRDGKDLWTWGFEFQLEAA